MKLKQHYHQAELDINLIRKTATCMFGPHTDGKLADLTINTDHYTDLLFLSLLLLLFCLVLFGESTIYEEDGGK